MPDSASAAKRSIMLPRAPMPFLHIVKLFVIPFTRYKYCVMKVFFPTFFTPDEFAPLTQYLYTYLSNTHA